MIIADFEKVLLTYYKDIHGSVFDPIMDEVEIIMDNGKFHTTLTSGSAEPWVVVHTLPKNWENAKLDDKAYFENVLFNILVEESMDYFNDETHKTSDKESVKKRFNEEVSEIIDIFMKKLAKRIK